MVLCFYASLMKTILLVKDELKMFKNLFKVNDFIISFEHQACGSYHDQKMSNLA